MRRRRRRTNDIGSFVLGYSTRRGRKRKETRTFVDQFILFFEFFGFCFLVDTSLSGFPFVEFLFGINVTKTTTWRREEKRREEQRKEKGQKNNNDREGQEKEKTKEEREREKHNIPLRSRQAEKLVVFF
jgi:hypothetical protein